MAESTMGTYPWDWIEPLISTPVNPLGEKPPEPPAPIKPQLIPGPRGISRAWEMSMAPLADMPWVPMRGRGANFMQGFIRGSSNAAQGQGMGRAKENERRMAAAGEANKVALEEYRSKRDEWNRYQRDASEQMKRDRQSAMKSLFDAAKEYTTEQKKMLTWDQLPREARAMLPEYKGQTMPESRWGFLLNAAGKGDKPTPVEKIPPLSFSPLISQRITGIEGQLRDMTWIPNADPNARQNLNTALAQAVEAGYRDGMSRAPIEQLPLWGQAVMSDQRIPVDVRMRLNAEAIQKVNGPNAR